MGFITINPEHRELLEAGLRAPSAHNVQPWLIRPHDDGVTYDLYCDISDDLPEDPTGKDAYLTMGAFAETLLLQAPNHNLSVGIETKHTEDDRGLLVAELVIGLSMEKYIDPLSGFVGRRHTNRYSYAKTPLSQDLKYSLESLGNVVVDPSELKEIVKGASKKAWQNPRYIKDLENWVRLDDSAEDGITPEAFNLSKADIVALKFAFWRGSIKSKILGEFFASSESGMFTSAGSAGVLCVEEMTPEALFSGGRRLLRSWVSIVEAGYSYQPFSVAVDDPDSAKEISKVIGRDNPVALYRIGKAKKSPRVLSNRKPLDKVLIN